MKLIKETLIYCYDDRPTGAQIIERYNEWSLHKKYILNISDLGQRLDKIKQNERELRKQEWETNLEFWEFLPKLICDKIGYQMT